MNLSSKYLNDKPLFSQFKCREDFIRAGIIEITPMTAKEIDSEEEQCKLLNDPMYLIEEKFDGTRGVLHFLKNSEIGYTRCFSRRVSKKTGWPCENTDLLPHLRDLDCPDLAGTIIDGEMFVPGKPFKTVSSTLNCLPEEAIVRQIENGAICFHAFDILYFKGKCVEHLPLWQRKILLSSVVYQVHSPFIKLVKCYSCNSLIPVQISYVPPIKAQKDTYPTLFKEVNALDFGNNPFVNPVGLSPKAYYEFIVLTGGEGVILKPKTGQYLHKRGREYQKIKKFLTREVIIMGFSEPTKYYDGKFPNDYWRYWCDAEDDTMLSELEEGHSAKEYHDLGYLPVTKYYYEDWIGNIRYGVIITNDEILKLDKRKKHNIETRALQGHLVKIIEVGECSGFDEEVREYFTDLREDSIGKVIEIKSNELFKDTGKMRHPRFLRVRYDKNAEECTWKDHISED